MRRNLAYPWNGKVTDMARVRLRKSQIIRVTDTETCKLRQINYHLFILPCICLKINIVDLSCFG